MKKKYGVVVIGGGLAGMTAAIAAARGGTRTALLQDRSVLGGNASSEIRMHICGADKHGFVKEARETGIIEELLLKNRYVNPTHSFSVQDAVFYQALKEEKGLDLYLNTRVLSCKTNKNRILSVKAYQSSTDTDFEFSAAFFIDSSGDGVIAKQAGALYYYGQEPKSLYGEEHAPESPSKVVMGSSLMFTAKDCGHPVVFQKPTWAYSFSEDDLSLRDHGQVSSGYWWLEVGGEFDTIRQSDKIYDELLKALYGVWDHIKNQPGHHAENYALDWVSSVVGKRESNRFIGDYVLTEKDLLTPTVFDDVVAYGGWNLDIHVPNGVFAFTKEPTTYYIVNKPYGIPYRALYSKNIENLFINGRLISASHLAFGSTRVMGTCAVIGQAEGTAAALAIKKGYAKTRDLLKNIGELQQILLRDDCYLPGIINADTKDKARTATSSATSCIPSYEVEHILDGHNRNEDGCIHCYQGTSFQDIVSLNFPKATKLKKLLIKFDSNLSKELTITLSDEVKRRQDDFPKCLAKDFDVRYYRNGSLVHEDKVADNIQRFVTLLTPKEQVDRINLQIHSTHGGEPYRIYEIRAY